VFFFATIASHERQIESHWLNMTLPLVPPRRILTAKHVCNVGTEIYKMLETKLVHSFSPTFAMPPRKRAQQWGSSASSKSSVQDAADPSMTSSPAPPASTPTASSKRAKFDKRFKTSTLSNEAVLGKSFSTYP
jgi:hypothetical protein